jgi:general transcription factor 3C polypeptide 3 (transcription factor C subunit 4)
MFAAVLRTCNSPVHFLQDTTTHKLLRRHIRSIDYSLVDGHRRDSLNKPFYPAKDGNGHEIVNDNMDVALLMLYGHVHYAGQSYIAALSE